MKRVYYSAEKLKEKYGAGTQGVPFFEYVDVKEFSPEYLETLCQRIKFQKKVENPPNPKEEKPE